MRSRWVGVGAVSLCVVLWGAWLVASPSWTSPTRFLVVAAALGAHVGVLLAAARGWVSLRAVIVGIAILLGLAIALPPRDSNDVWGYVSYSRVLTEHGANPYRSAPADFPDDPLLDRMSAEYRETPTIYGPAFTTVSAVGTGLAGDSPVLNRLWFQALALGAGITALWLVARRSGNDPGALAFLGLSPVFIAIINGAHPDLIIGALLLAAVVLADERRTAWVGVALAAAILVKVVAVLPAAALGLWIWRRHGTAVALAVGRWAVPLIAGAYLAVGGLDALTPVREAAEGFGSRGQAWELVRQSWSDAYAAAGVARAAEVAHIEVAHYATPLVVVVAFVVLARLTRDRDPAVPTAGGGLGFLLSAAYVLPWYSGWVLPAAATAWRTAIARFALAQAALLALVYADPPGRLPPEGRLLDLSTRWLPLCGVALAVGFVTWCFLHRSAPRRPGTAGDAQPGADPSTDAATDSGVRPSTTGRPLSVAG